ncbi:replication factor A protein [Trifolium repens]|nr:replication factor A protein [Trifolium repens]
MFFTNRSTHLSFHSNLKRVLRLWKVPTFLNPSGNGSIEMVLVNDKGGKIHATVNKQLIYITLHPYKIVFQLKTKVKLFEGSSIDPYGLTVTNISDVCAHTHDYEFLVDVIGYMTGLSVEREYIRDEKITKMIVAELTDHSGKCEIALFGHYVDDLTKKMDKQFGGLPIVVVQFAKVKIFRDKASLQNVMNTTWIFVNPDIAEVETFKNSVVVHGAVVDLDFDGVADESDVVLDSKSIEFLEDVIVTPVKVVEKSVGEDEVEGPFKRNLSKDFNSASKRPANKRLKPVKIEKE